MLDSLKNGVPQAEGETAEPGIVTGLISRWLGSLDEHSQPEAVEAALVTIARESRRFSDVQQQQVRHAAKRLVKRLDIGNAAMVDTAFESSQAVTDTSDRTLGLEDPKPWPESVEGAQLLDDLATLFARHAILPEGAADALALWTLFTYTFEAAYIAPSLGITSATKRCGKTTVLSLLAAVVRKALPTSNISPAGVFRCIEAFSPTLLMDEAETFINTGNEDLRGILNSGHTKSMARIIRCTGEDFAPTVFSTWCPKVFGLIGSLPSTLEDRSILIRMRRQTGFVKAERMRPQVLNEVARTMQAQMMRWAKDHLHLLKDVEPAIPGVLHDRAADNWTPLLAIADCVAGAWPSRAREAAVALHKQSGQDDGDVSVLLLQDLKNLFEAHAGPKAETPGKLTSEFIVARLAGNGGAAVA